MMPHGVVVPPVSSLIKDILTIHPWAAEERQEWGLVAKQGNILRPMSKEVKSALAIQQC